MGDHECWNGEYGRGRQLSSAVFIQGENGEGKPIDSGYLSM